MQSHSTHKQRIKQEREKEKEEIHVKAKQIVDISKKVNVFVCFQSK